jgi:lysophospholipase
MNRAFLKASVFLLLVSTGCDENESKEQETDTKTDTADNRTCESGEFLVTLEACGEDGNGELTEYCVGEKWEEHSCNGPADWPDHNFESGFVKGCSGQIHYQKWAQKQQAVANLVLVNGRTEYSDKFHHLIPLLTRQWDIIIFDHYGQGRSEGVRAHAVDFDEYQVCDFGKILEATTDPSLPTLVMAHSMGGFIAIRFEQLHPGTLKGLVFSAPMLGIDTSPMTTEVAIKLAQSAIDGGTGEAHYKENYLRTDCDDWKQTHDCDLYEEFRRDPLTVIGYPTFGWLYAALTGMQEALTDADKVEIPVMIFQAELDNTVLPEPQSEFCDSAPDCELFVREGDYHDMFSELDRDEIVEQSLAFFDNILRTM